LIRVAFRSGMFPLSKLQNTVKVLYHNLEGRGFDSRGIKMNFFNLPNPSGRPRPWVTRPLREMSMRSRKITFLGSRARPERRTDNLPAICGPIVKAMWDP
jgi:hypothetical protein